MKYAKLMHHIFHKYLLASASETSKNSFQLVSYNSLNLNQSYVPKYIKNGTLFIQLLKFIQLITAPTPLKCLSLELNKNYTL